MSPRKGNPKRDPEVTPPPKKGTQECPKRGSPQEGDPGMSHPPNISPPPPISHKPHEVEDSGCGVRAGSRPRSCRYRRDPVPPGVKPSGDRSKPVLPVIPSPPGTRRVTGADVLRLHTPIPPGSPQPPRRDRRPPAPAVRLGGEKWGGVRGDPGIGGDPDIGGGPRDGQEPPQYPPHGPRHLGGEARHLGVG